LAKNEPPQSAGFSAGAKLRADANNLVALAVKQPWAALLVAGLKTVEVRTWMTRRRGRLLIHASKIPDDRPEGWALITPELSELAALRGGIIGIGELVDCVRYNTAKEFTAAVAAHRNSPEWFRPSGLFGFVFQNLRPIAYHACPGQTMFFGVPDFSLPG
jgi:ASCH domain